MAKPTYKQCTLRKGNVKTVVWIPSCLAKVGKNVVIKATGETWKVESASKSEMLEEYLVERSRDYLKQREASDI